MELKDFVKATLEQIVEGVSSAKGIIDSHGGTINPTEVEFKKDGAYNAYYHAMPQDVTFDVGLTTTDKTGSSEGIGVFLGSVSLGKKNDAGIENVAISKVKFTVPLVLPPGKSMRDN